MAINTTQISTGGGWIAISATSVTLTTALSDAINEAEAQGITMEQAMMSISGGGATSTWMNVVIIAKRH